MATPGEIALNLERAVGHLEPAVVWRLSDDFDDVARLAGPAAERAFRGLIDRYRALSAEHEEEQVAQRSAEERRDLRAQVQAQIVAFEAGRRADVQTFRSAHFGDPFDPLSPDETEAWIRARAGMPLRIEAGGRTTRQILKFPTSDGGFDWVDVGGSAELTELAELADRLTAAYTWSQGSAVAFVLTDRVPRLRGVQWGLRSHMVEPPADGLAITLEVPWRTSPQEVAQIYSEARRKFLGDVPRDRPMEESGAYLAVFVAEVNDGREWAKAFEEWKRRFPDRASQYKNVRAFSTAARGAYKRATGHTLTWRATA